MLHKKKQTSHDGSCSHWDDQNAQPEMCNCGFTKKKVEDVTDAEIDMAKEIVRECRMQTLIKLRKLIKVYKDKYQILSDKAVDENFAISVRCQDSDTMRLLFMGQHIATIDWVEMEIYNVKEEPK